MGDRLAASRLRATNLYEPAAEVKMPQLETT